MVIDGCTMLSTRDNFLYHEMMSHPALFTHPDPKRVCIIGGGDCGTLREVLKHPGVEQAVQIDIDERVTRLAEIYFPELTASNGDPRAHLLFEDGVRWIQQAEAGGLDIIIVDSTDPVGPAVGLFTSDFYADCRRALGSGGILVQQSESPLYHMRILTEMHGAMRSAGFTDTRTLFFPQPIYPSGWWSATMAGSDLSLERFSGGGRARQGLRYPLLQRRDSSRGARSTGVFPPRIGAGRRLTRSIGSLATLSSRQKKGARRAPNQFTTAMQSR
jgi:spermidine synthase